MPMPEYVRVRDKKTGHEYSVVRSALDEESQVVLDKPAAWPDGRPMEPKYRIPSLSKSTTAVTDKEKN